MSEHLDLDAMFAAARAAPIPADLTARVRARLIVARPVSRSARWWRAALLVVLGGTLAAAVLRLWPVRIDPRAGTVDGGKLREREPHPDGSERYQVELPDGRRVDVRISPAPNQRHVEVDMPAPIRR